MFKMPFAVSLLILVPVMVKAEDSTVGSWYAEELGPGYSCQLQSSANGAITYGYVSAESWQSPNQFAWARLTIDRLRPGGILNLIDDRASTMFSTLSGWHVVSRNHEFGGEYHLEANIDSNIWRLYHAKAVDPLGGYWEGTCQREGNLTRRY